jgi:hypothetical protein
VVYGSQQLLNQPLYAIGNIYIYIYIASKPRNIVYIPQLTDEHTEKYKVKEYMDLYSSIPRNIILYSSVIVGPGPPPPPQPGAHIFLG